MQLLPFYVFTKTGFCAFHFQDFYFLLIHCAVYCNENNVTMQISLKGIVHPKMKFTP